MAISDIQLLSLIAGLIGSLLSAFFTFGYEPYPLSDFCSPDEVPIVNRRNKRRRLGQASGLVLIAVSYCLQLFATIS